MSNTGRHRLLDTAPVASNATNRVSLLEALRRMFPNAGPSGHRALAEAYAPILRGFLLPCAAYYTFVTWAHWRDETGLHFVVLAGLSALTVLVCMLMWRRLKNDRTVSLHGMELIGLTANLLIYANVAVYMYLGFQEAKLIYFVLMVVAFSTSGVTFRVTAVSVGLSLATLFWFASTYAPATVSEYVSIGVVASVVAIGMSYLLRKALSQQVSARLKADALTEHAQYLAATDMLTSLPSRRQVFDEIDARVRSGQPFWLGLIDLDGFKAINDAYGHALGDQLLQAVASRIRSALTLDTHFGRLGGDEFAWCCPGELSRQHIENVARDLILTISQPYMIDGRSVHIGASIGFCHSPTMAGGSAEVYENADYALYAAKDSRRGDVLVFSASHQLAMSDASSLDRALREADIDAEFSVQFQPQVSLTSGRVVGFEALARWNSPALGSVRPDLFIRAAERSGQIIDLTPALFRKALAEAATWPADIAMSFNLSANDLEDPMLSDTLLSAIAESGVAPSRVQFELTETSVMRDTALSEVVLGHLVAAGCSIALDDFGSGYSSFAYLDRFPLDTLKIDRGFVRQVTTNTVSREIVAGMMRLCRTLGLTCILEGVETSEELEILRSLGADLIQGYLFGTPVDASRIPTLLREPGPHATSGPVDAVAG